MIQKIKEIFFISKFSVALLTGASIYYTIVFIWNREEPNDDTITAVAFAANYFVKFLLVKYWVFHDTETAHAGIQIFWYMLLGAIFTLMTNYLRNELGIDFITTQVILFPITAVILFQVSKKIFKYPTKNAEES